MKRKQELLNMDYGSLQSTEEYKFYLEKFIYNQSKNMSSEISYIIKKSYEDNDTPLSYEDIENETIINYETIKYDIEEELKNIENDKDNLNEFLKEEELKNIEEYRTRLNNVFKEEEEEEIKEILENSYLSHLNFDEYLESQEVLQWFIMDDRLLIQLEERGQPVLNNEYWGRCCCGQLIELDGVIIQIFKEWFLNLNWIEDKFKLN